MTSMPKRQCHFPDTVAGDVASLPAYCKLLPDIWSIPQKQSLGLVQQNAGTIYGEENQAIFKYIVIYYITFSEWKIFF